MQRARDELEALSTREKSLKQVQTNQVFETGRDSRGFQLFNRGYGH